MTDWWRRGGSPRSMVGYGASRARTLHLAEGILVGLRRQAPEAALAELMAASRESGLSAFAIADALVAVAAGEATDRGDDEITIATVRRCWGDLLGTEADDCAGHVAAG